MSLQIGETYAGYRILRLLGSGGMGEVHLAQHPRLPRQEALKVLRPDISGDPSFRERFIREADLAASLRHPNVVSIHDRGEHDGHLWIAMDYVEGSDAAELLRTRYPAGMPVELVTSIIAAISSALDYAHKKGLLHRDVKPANIIVADLDTDEPHAYLADFGIARTIDDISGITTTNMTVGTVAYAAPEQLMGEPLDGRADQYALAATTYHLVTGLQLFPHSNPAVVISRHLNAPIPALADTRPDLAPLDPILAAGLAKNPDDRFASCGDFARVLTDATTPRRAGGAIAPTTPAPVARVPRVSPTSSKVNGASPDQSKSASSYKGWLIAVSVAAILLLGVGGVLWGPWQHPQSTNAEGSSANSPTDAPPSVPTTTTAPPTAPSLTTQVRPPSISTQAAPSLMPTSPVSNPNGPGCSPNRPDKCGQWTPEQAAFACRATLSGADYTTNLQRMLVNRYGLSEDSAFFLGKEAMYSINSGGYLNTGSMADGPHPLCNDIVP